MKRVNVFTIKQVRESSALYNIEDRFIRSQSDAFKVVREVTQIQEEACEVFGIITLNTKNQIAGVHVISRGSLNQAVVHPREVFKAALLNNAASIVCFHNHPSGIPDPSHEDIKLTERLIEAGKILGIEVLDHVIIGDLNDYSMKARGDM